MAAMYLLLRDQGQDVLDGQAERVRLLGAVVLQDGLGDALHGEVARAQQVVGVDDDRRAALGQVLFR